MPATVVAGTLLALAAADGGYAAGAFALLGVVAWWTVAAGTTLRRNAPRGPGRSAKQAAICLFALAGFSAASMLWASDPGDAFTAMVRIAAYAGVFTAAITFYRAEQIRPWLWAIAAVALGITAVGLATRFVPALAPSDTQASAIAVGRLQFPIGYWNGFGAMAALATACCAWAASSFRADAAQPLFVSLIPACLLAIYLSASRGALVSAVLGLVVLAAFAGRPRQIIAAALPGLAAGGALVGLASTETAFNTASGSGQEAEGALILVATLVTGLLAGWAHYRFSDRLAALLPRPTRRTVTVSVLAAIAVLALVLNPVQRLHEFTSVPNVASPSETSHLLDGGSSGRAQFWKAALQEFRSAPLIGEGSGSYASWWTQHGALALNVQNAHSLPLETLGELGLIGFLPLLTLFGIACRSVLRGRTRRMLRSGADQALLVSILAMGILQLSIDWTWQLPAVSLPTLLAVAMLTGAEEDGVTEGGPAWDAAILALAIPMVLACGLLGAQRLALEISRTDVARQHLGAAESAARQASDLTPWDSEPTIQLALIQELQGRLPGARSTAARATTQALDDWQDWLTLARLQIRTGNVVGAFRSLTKARDLSPRMPVLFFGATPPPP